MLEPKDIRIENLTSTIIKYPKDGEINLLFYNYEDKELSHTEGMRDVFIENFIIGNYKDMFKQISINKDGTIKAS